MHPTQGRLTHLQWGIPKSSDQDTSLRPPPVKSHPAERKEHAIAASNILLLLEFIRFTVRRKATLSYHKHLKKTAELIEAASTHFDVRHPDMFYFTKITTFVICVSLSIADVIMTIIHILRQLVTSPE